MIITAFRPWAFWRRLQYGTAFGGFWALVAVFVYFAYFYTPANCFDGIMNGAEVGVDCGGACLPICASQVAPAIPLEAKSFAIRPGQYNAVAYLENPNPSAGLTELPYKISLYAGEQLVTERTGTTVLPPNNTYAIFEGPIQVDRSVEITRTELSLGSVDVWWPATMGREQFRTINTEILRADTEPRVEVVLENTDFETARDVEIVAVIRDTANEPVTVSRTVVDRIAGGAQTEVVFTWPERIAHTVTSCQVPTDVALAIDVSGSMNNDTTDEARPEPITSALAAASTFVTTAQENDQVAVVTYASEAAVRQPLSAEVSLIADGVRDITIDPAEEEGYTNTAAALQAAATELSSARQNPDARRVIVLLTDGLPTSPDVTSETFRQTVVTTAGQIQNDAVTIYAIGLGESVDAGYIAELSGAPERAYVAPTAADLQVIYESITTSICEVAPPRVDVIPKTATFIETY